MKNYKFNFFFFIVIIFMASKNTFALEPILVDDNLTEIIISKNLEYYEDKSAKLKIDDIIKKDIKWDQNNKNNFNFGYEKSNYWFRFRINNKKNNLDKLYFEVDTTWLANIELFIPERNGGFDNRKTGILHPFSTRDVDYRTFIFSLKEKTENEDYFLMVNSHGPLEFSIKLLTPDKLYNRIIVEYPILFIYYGFIIIMIIYNLLIYLSIKDKSYIYYVLCLTGFVFTQFIMNGIANQYLWSHTKFWNELIMFMCLSTASAVLFFKYYVQTKEHTPIFDKIISIMALINFFFIFEVVILFKLFDFSSDINRFNIQLVTILNFITNSTFIIASGVFAYKKNRQAFFFFIAFSLFIFGAGIRQLQVFSILPLNFFTEYSMQINSLFTITLLSLGLADKIKILKDDLQVLNEHLEDKVEERTIELEQANAKLKEIDKLKTDFFANISHEIRTPLTLILSPVESVLQGEYGKEVDRDFAKNIQKNSIRLLRLVNNILDFSKIEEGRMGIKVKEVDIVRMIKNYISTISTSAESRGIDLSFKASCDSLILYLDIEKADKIAMNLFSNALKFTDKGGQMKIRIHEDDKNCYIEVEDSGVGIPSNMLVAIFDRFSQVDGSSTRKYEGTGIGLSLAKVLVEMHGGSISVQSKHIDEYPDDHGTMFTLTFIKGKSHFENRPEVEILIGSELDESISDRRRFQGMREMIEFKERDEELISSEAENSIEYDNDIRSHLLIVEDNRDMRNFLKSLLENNYKIDFAVDGEDGLKKTKSLVPDLIITDVMMPKMDGYQMTGLIKDDPKLKKIPILMLTAKSEIAYKIEGLEYGADDYLTKPFNSRELLVRLKTLLEKRESQRIIEDRKNEIEEELETARLLQQKLLPGKIPDVEGYRSFVTYIPLDKVGGDFYDFAVDDNKMEFLIADVSGHGMPGAFLSMIAKMAFEGIDNRESTSKVLKIMNKVICSSTVKNNYITVFYCHLDRKTRKLTYSNAGHFPPLVYRKDGDEFFELSAKGKPLGWFEELSLEEKTIQLYPDDRLVFYTDGIIESSNPDGKQFADEKFKDFISLQKDSLPEQFSEKLIKHLKEFTCSEKFDDDLCLVVVDVL